MNTTFTIARADGRNHQVPFCPIEVTAGLVEHTFALHRNGDGSYSVSDPVSGCSVLPRVSGKYKGITCVVRNYTLSEAKREAIEQVVALAELVGFERFNSVIANVLLTPDSQIAADKLRTKGIAA